MHALKEIAFVPMTYTMDIDQPAVAEFKPAVVYPYHYKGSDPEAFAAKVAEGAAEVKVVQGKWYG
jgi:L-ascorbate metabolism protein UlaG (beta-lactamase superfamily)